MAASPDDGADDIEAGRRLFARQCTFIGGARSLAGLPEPGLPEVAFAGRSNVGKSSLVNALTGRKTLARTSHTPGRTREINLFNLGGQLVLVDLPGYGFASAAKSEAKEWSRATREFLRGRAKLKRVCLLVDARRGVMGSDEAAMELIDEAAVSFQIVLTKADKLKAPELEAVLADVSARARAHRAAHPEIVATSRRAGLGLDVLRAVLAAVAQP